MTLGELIDQVGDARIHGDSGVTITGVAIDSRRVREGDAFVAVPGTLADGHDYVADAIARGANAVVVECAPDEVDVPVVVTKSTARAAALLAARINGNVADRLRLFGCTGTDGKSSTSWILRSILDRPAHGSFGLIGTLGWGENELHPSTHTTPDPVTLHTMLAQMESAGCVGVVMEVSSHAVRQHRTWGLDFEVGILTNVTHDHLDYHHGFSDYRDAKETFCRSLTGTRRRGREGTLVYWKNDPVAREIGEASAGRSVSVGTNDRADAYVDNVSRSWKGTSMVLHLPDTGSIAVTTPMAGAFVDTNACLAGTAAHVAGASAGAIRDGIARLSRIPGRFETLGGSNAPVVVIDYAHTPTAFENTLALCRNFGARRLITVFGCGGDRDREKRPMMGEIAVRLSDECIITTDNPRRESVGAINAEILDGISEGRKVTVEPDRAAAIRRAIEGANVGDVVALLGKGHENYQWIGDEKVPFSDRDEASAVLGEMDR